MDWVGVGLSLFSFGTFRLGGFISSLAFAFG